ncbi:2-C-methyl-D-erythritol 2,4-cyclodiphosphate synthase [Nesterenkonia flava]|uniref:2-C-methyl-D-erythritol 2,4-cyclodiphosphate synthase n=1 Tax=Nesterenkonia flava TaxID=469799 RepID=A0ABU1FY16_9MICC|nr:2-C-methyl-D-erythritol 2,4-cyclodiphosphate synthase [Nesterenkonia flava]MDR5713081.1 2-C-methyl-D-erythritol 2,4-cyclodiphosphate synthase [Nesterenkonia flava]
MTQRFMTPKRVMTQRPDAVGETPQHRAFVMVAAGSGTRLGYGIPKAAVLLEGRSLLDHALDALTGSPEGGRDRGIARPGQDLVILVLPAEPDAADLTTQERAAHERLTSAVPRLRGAGLAVLTARGGTTRSASVRAGVERVSEHAAREGWQHEGTAVLIHDAARPLTPPEVFLRVAEAVAAGAPAVVPAVPVSDTIKHVRPSGPSEGPAAAERVQSTPARSQLRAVQTPQGFSLAFLTAAFEHIQDLPDAEAEKLTDEAMIAEDLGTPVSVVPGHTRALKVTTETDLITARALLQHEETTMSAHHETTSPHHRDRSGLPRVGIGHDIHAFAPADQPTELWLAGLHWPDHQGLAGHSDGDAVAHACCAALFSAAGLGDLGTHFGADTIGTARDDVAGASGVALLSEAASIVREAGFEIGNISAQFVGRRPKFAPRRSEAEQVLSAAAGAPVSVSATTSDGLGFTGRSEGIAATATALVYPV